MNNILNYRDYLTELAKLLEYASENELNEGTGIKGLGNKIVQRKIRKELGEEIEMSKTIMDGITNGLEELDDSFNEIKSEIEAKEGSDIKGEKQKILDGISKILEQSRKSTWDLNELIDDGEIDYTGFVANAGFATLIYFGTLMFPMRTTVILHKGYNYFFNLIKNTIRKSLVMLQMNFDQFENLIIQKSFQSAGYQDTLAVNSEISDYYADLEKEFLKLSGSKKNTKAIETKLKLARDKANELRRSAKAERASANAFDTLDSYNNTYTRSLEVLRQYSQEDVQKQLDAIKNSMQKLAGSDPDFGAYVELVIAAAEEHAYKVSSSIYNRFAKMTEVFSLPNQKKMIQLITDANAEAASAAKAKNDKIKADADMKRMDEEIAKNDEYCAKIFTGKDGATLGKHKSDGTYASADGHVWDYPEFRALDEEDRDKFEAWLVRHDEVLDTCDETLRAAILVPGQALGKYYDYVKSLVEYVGPALVEVEEEESDDDSSDDGGSDDGGSEDGVSNDDDDAVNDGFEYRVPTFSEYLFEGKSASEKRKERQDKLKTFIKSSENFGSLVDKVIDGKNMFTKSIYNDLVYIGTQDINDEWKEKLDELKKDIDNQLSRKATTKSTSTIKIKGEAEREIKVKPEVAEKIVNDNDIKSPDTESPKSEEHNKKSTKTSAKYYLKFNDLEDSVKSKLVNDYVTKKEIANASLMVIGDKFLKGVFTDNAEEIVSKIGEVKSKKKIGLSKTLYGILKNAIEKLKTMNNFGQLEEQEDTNTKKSGE